jgi:hypothetical protein
VGLYLNPPEHPLVLSVDKKSQIHRIERDVIKRGIFNSVSDLTRKLRCYLNAYSANARPIQWKYSDATRRIRGNEFTDANRALAMPAHQ